MNNNNTAICAAATAPIILGISVNDIYLIGMLVIAFLTLISPFIIAIINKSSVNKDDVKEAEKDAEEIIKEIKDDDRN